jgi:hypothetical protein
LTLVHANPPFAPGAMLIPGAEHREADAGGLLGDDRVGAACVAAQAECAQACLACVDACLAERASEPVQRCVARALDCADLCEVAGRLLLRPHAPHVLVLQQLLDLVALACQVCAGECAPQVESHDPYRVCRESCLRCAEATLRLRAALDRSALESPARH